MSAVGLWVEMLVAAFGIASVRLSKRATLAPSPTSTSERASSSGTQSEPCCCRELLGIGTRTNSGPRNLENIWRIGVRCLIAVATCDDIDRGGDPVCVPNFNARIRSRDCSPVSPPPDLGRYDRYDANSSEVKRIDYEPVEPHARNGFEDISWLPEFYGTILRHLVRPFQVRLVELVCVNEEWPT